MQATTITLSEITESAATAPLFAKFHVDYEAITPLAGFVEYVNADMDTYAKLQIVHPELMWQTPCHATLIRRNAADVFIHDGIEFAYDLVGPQYASRGPLTAKEAIKLLSQISGAVVAA